MNEMNEWMIKKPPAAQQNLCLLSIRPLNVNSAHAHKADVAPGVMCNRLYAIRRDAISSHVSPY